MPETYEELCRELLTHPGSKKVVVLPRPVADIIQSMREGDPGDDDAKLVHQFYELLASEIRSSGR